MATLRKTVGVYERPAKRPAMRAMLIAGGIAAAAVVAAAAVLLL